MATGAARAMCASSSGSHLAAQKCAARERCPGGSRAEPRGTEGFGYDPIFIPDGNERTVAELGNEWKAEHSHRARAAKAFLAAV